ncbi:hypothetical protein HZS_770 [Henneguya salminicola]|nr:hypothetical protein HZS_770 [Henneguya salminicola]
MFYYLSTPLTGCFFPFSQCIWRRIQSGGQSTLYRDNETARSIFKMFAAFAFIKEDKRTKHWKNTYASIFLNNNSENF